jgi:hypothetical protein
MIYSCCTFLDYYSVFLPHAYFLPTHRNGEVPIFSKLPYYARFNLRLVVNFKQLTPKGLRVFLVKITSKQPLLKAVGAKQGPLLVFPTIRSCS